jgi:hypothetical protein
VNVATLTGIIYQSFGRRAVPLLLAGLAITAASAQQQVASAGTSTPVISRPAAMPVDDPTRLLPVPATGIPASLDPLFELTNSDVKFQLPALMATLSDRKHEGWVLFAYPDPKTAQPLIGAGFTLDLPARAHPQGNPLNSHQFLEPSSAQLWQAAGLEPVRLESILAQYDRNLQKWGKKNYRKKIKKQQLPPDVTDEEAASLLRISAVQAIHNARAYCLGFDQLTGSQQMAIAQLVYQMGVNLEGFTTFLSIMNSRSPHLENASLSTAEVTDREYWDAVQLSLIQSQWARKYSTRAITVIAMLDPDYIESPRAAEHRVKVILKPAKHSHKQKKVKSAKVKST